MLQSAVDNMFGQKDTKIVVRLPMAGDDKIVQESVSLPKSDSASDKKSEASAKSETLTKQETTMLALQDPVVAEEVRQEIDNVVEEQKSSISKPLTSQHADNVTMIIDLFDGKVID